MKPLILVKHSLPEIVETNLAREWTLSEEGRSRAKKLAEILLPYAPESIISSIEPKARETASILAETLQLNMHVHEGLHEHDRSSAPYYSRGEFQKLIQDFFQKPETLVFGNETAIEALERFRNAVYSILNFREDEKVLVVSHGTVISLFVAWLTGCDGYTLWHELGLPSFVLLDLQSKKLLITENLP